MEPQDQAQITFSLKFRSEIHSIVISVGQEGGCLDERISRSGDLSTIYSVSKKRFLLPVMLTLLHLIKFLLYNNLKDKNLRVQGVRSGLLKEESILGHTVHCT